MGRYEHENDKQNDALDLHFCLIQLRLGRFAQANRRGTGEPRKRWIGGKIDLSNEEAQNCACTCKSSGPDIGEGLVLRWYEIEQQRPIERHDCKEISREEHCY